MSDQSIDVAIARIKEQVSQQSWEVAERLCRDVLSAAPENWEAWFLLAIARIQQQDRHNAEAAFVRATELNPHKAAVWNNLSLVVADQGRSVEAERYARQAVALDPTGVDYWNNLGNALFRQNRWAEAIQAYRQCLHHNDQYALAWNNLAAAEQKLGNLGAAQAAYERSLALNPDDLGILTNFADLIRRRGQLQRSLELLSHVLLRDPRTAPAWIAQGHIFLSLNDHAAAEAAFRSAAALAPHDYEARFNLAVALKFQWLLSEAESLVRQLLLEDPQEAAAHTLLGEILEARGQTAEALVELRRSIDIAPFHGHHGKLLCCEQYAGGVTAQRLYNLHREWNDRYAAPLAPLPPPIVPPRLTQRILRLGVVSKNFGQHPIGFCVLPAIESLDRQRCEVVCYSDQVTSDPATAHFRSTVARWHDVKGLTDDELANRIQEDDIDILFDLEGHNSRRMLVFARRPAPCQVSWFGYVGTTGLAAMDYILADRFHIPLGEEQWYTERVLRLPDDYVCYRPSQEAPAVSALPGLKGGSVTFGCFSKPAKYSPQILDAWAEILLRVPRSRLLLKFAALDQPEIIEWIHGRFSRRGVSPGRILLEGWSPRSELLAAYNRVDIALDTQPYSGGLTTCESLWMGVPVITCPGKSFAGRHSASHLTNAGYDRFIAPDLEGYIELAVSWAHRLDELAALREQMRQRVRQSPLCDVPRFAHNLLHLLEEVGKTHR
jgi:predicted O-linked N-acetylglucosamine transferase (SPINDLY family)